MQIKLISIKFTNVFPIEMVSKIILLSWLLFPKLSIIYDLKKLNFLIIPRELVEPYLDRDSPHSD